ncbi:E3 ubiquitin ligase family protein [Haloarcula sp. S1CR25-12]|uniref:E3 ubiquitin ligase family protein n=1 Tax=Haloarcula saliterrae TaxID=2950534 RepID=A0ABU2FAX6_9EURY|nr:GIDE domain-containing protein [Haloarcula sp. S1CR25-12]MDS0259427.1 E3 ubiquitin ligase family protein [Haloarcula sp. S1CR25-12]
MAAIPTWFLLALGLVPIGFMAVYVYYELETAAGRSLRRRGVTQRGITAATVVSLGTVLAFGFLGPVNLFASGDAVEAVGYPTLGLLIPYVLGLLGLNVALTNARTWRRLHPDNDVPTGSVAPGAVACTGEIAGGEVGAAPVTGRDAVCWSWSVDVLDPHGVGDVGQREQWATVDGSDGGGVFVVDDGSGPVRVDPDGATLDLWAERAVPLDADEPPSFDSPAPDVERTHGDRQRRYEESVLTPDDHVAVAGTARETSDGLTVAGDSYVAVGTLSTAATRYRNSAAVYGVVGLVDIAVSVRLLAGLYGVF